MSYRPHFTDDRAETHEDVWLSIHLETESNANQVSFLLDTSYYSQQQGVECWGINFSGKNKHMKGPRKHHLHLFEFNTEP